MRWSDEQLVTLRTDNGFYLRSENMTRMEVFSDTAYAFALTMLVVSVGSIPGNQQEMIAALKNVPAFLLSFTQIVAFWWSHRVWSQRYGLETVTATVLTLSMIFVILVYVYPLRLIFSGFFEYVTQGWLESEFKINDIQELANLFVIYGVGFALLTGIIACLYRHAHAQREDLKLTGYEQVKTRQMAAIFFTQSVVGVISALFAFLAPVNFAVYAGFIYVVLGAVVPLVSRRFEHQIAAFELSTEHRQ